MFQTIKQLINEIEEMLIQYNENQSNKTKNRFIKYEIEDLLNENEPKEENLEIHLAKIIVSLIVWSKRKS